MSECGLETAIVPASARPLRRPAQSPFSTAGSGGERAGSGAQPLQERETVSQD